MHYLVTFLGISAVLFATPALAQGRGERPAPPPSRYGFTLKFDHDALPKGVSLREMREGGPPRWFITNSSEKPLVLYERFQGKDLVSGTKLIGGQVYQYFPNGVPMEGKTHLKGWQAPFGEIKETLLYLPSEPAKIYEGRKPGLSKDLPPPEAVSIPATYDGQTYEIKATVHYHLNEAYDAHYREPEKK
jgi:hypothetical protein